MTQEFNAAAAFQLELTYLFFSHIRKPERQFTIIVGKKKSVELLFIRLPETCFESTVRCRRFFSSAKYFLFYRLAGRKKTGSEGEI